MARIQYRPAARSRGFRPQQLSTVGINRMREESTRLIQSMERQRLAEKEQRDKDLQAMRENAEYTERITRDNQATELRNLQNEGQQRIANIQGAQEQARIDAEATQQILGSLVDFSQKAAGAIARRQKEELDEQIAAANAVPIQSRSPEEIEASISGEAALTQGGIQLGTDYNVNGVLTNEDPLETKKAHVSNPGFTGVQRKIVANRELVADGEILLNSRFQDTERVYTADDGTTFTGVEARNDLYLSRQLQQITIAELLKGKGITDSLYVADALTKLGAIGKVYDNQARKNETDINDAALEQRAKDTESGGTTRYVTAAFADRKLAFGNAKALDGFEAAAQTNPNIDLEVFRQADLKGNGNTFDKEFPNRWRNMVQARNEYEIKQSQLDERLKKAEDREWVNANIDSIQEAYNQNPQQASMLVLQRYHNNGMTVPPVIRDIEREAFKRNKDVMQSTIAERTRYGILDLPFINSIKDPALQKQAREAFNAQEAAKYGPEALGIKKGFKATARALTKINPNEFQGSAQTFLVQARLESEYLKQLNLTNDPLKALEKVNEMVDKGNAGDKSSPFYIDPSLGDNNRPVFPNIESSDREVAEMNTYIDKQILSSGISVVDKPFALATSDQMDAAYTSSLSGVMQYPPGILKVAKQFNLKPSEVYNAHRQANNAATGVNKPLLAPTPTTLLLDNVSPEMRKLFLSDEPAQIRRASAVTTGNLPRRASMGGSSFNAAAVPNNYGGPIAEAAARNNIPPEILAGLIDTESNFNPAAESPVGARGLGQFMPPTAAEFGVDVNDPMSSIDGAARYLRYLMDYFNGDMNLAIYAYNGGMGNIERFGGPIPGNKENEEYLQKVLDNSTKYR